VSGPGIGIVDYGMGNRRSVEKALERVGARPLLSSDAEALGACDGLILPGVGAFPRAMANLRELGLDELLVDRLQAGTPLLGICLGMQLLFEDSVELGGANGLGLIPGTVGELETRGAKLPHIGWNLVSWAHPSPLTEGMPEACAFYHVHSFAPQPRDPADVLGTSRYGASFVSAVDASRHAPGPLFGVQFHPEKSSDNGLRLLANFSSVCARVAA
jgi:glutamine amidotransferase